MVIHWVYHIDDWLMSWLPIIYKFDQLPQLFVKGLAASLPALSKHDEKQAVRQGLPCLGVRDASVKLFDGVQPN